MLLFKQEKRDIAALHLISCEGVETSKKTPKEARHGKKDD